MTLFIDDETFGDYFTGFEHMAWRLETRRGYDSDRTSERYQQFLSGEGLADNTNSPWCANIRLQTEQGQANRARTHRRHSADRGPVVPSGQCGTEQRCGRGRIRFMSRADAVRRGLPDFDFWLFDSRVLARFNWDDASRRLELTTEPYAVVQACQVRDAAWHYASA